MALIGLIEISSKSVKYITPVNGRPQKRTELLKAFSKDSPLDETYSEIKAAVMKVIRMHKYVSFRKCILTGCYADDFIASYLIDSFKMDIPDLTVIPLSTKEQLDYSYQAFLDEEKKRGTISTTDDIFVETSDHALLMGFYRDGESVDFKELPLGLKSLQSSFNEDCTGSVTIRYQTIQRLFKDKCKEEFRAINWSSDKRIRVVFSGGATKSLVGDQDSGKQIQGKEKTIEEISGKVASKLSNYSERFADNPEAIWDNKHYAKMMTGVLSSIYVYAVMEHFGVGSACFSGFGTIDSYFYRVALGKTRHFRFKELYKALKAHQNVFISGPTGSGKSYAAEQCARKLKCDYYFTGAISNEYKLLGYMDANGNYVSTEFRKAYENGGLFLFDEVDASFPQPLLAFNAALAGNQMDFPDKTVPKNEKFYCIATANTFGNGASRQYVGRNQLDAAFLDRFVFLDWPYDNELERNLTDNEEWVEYVQKVRAAIDKLGMGKMGVRHIVSPRATISGAELLKAGLDRERVESMVIWKGLEKETIQMIKNNMD